MWLHARDDESDKYKVLKDSFSFTKNIKIRKFLGLQHLFVLWIYEINLVYHMYFWLQDKKYYPTAEEVFGPEVEVRACKINCYYLIRLQNSG